MQKVDPSASLFFIPAVHVKYLQIIVIILLTSNIGCEDPELVGLETLPDTEGLNLQMVDTFTINGSYHVVDDLITANITSHTYLLGGMNDPVFGKVSSNLYTQFGLGSSNIEVGDPIVDSVVVYLKYVGSYGSLDRLRGYQYMKVFELNNDLDPDFLYRQDTTHEKGTERASFGYWRGEEATIYAPKGNSLVGDTLSLQPHLRIKLDNQFGDKILSADFTDNETFTSAIKGLVFEPQVDQLPESNGAIYYYDVDDGETRMRVYFHNDISGGTEYKILDLFIGKQAGTHTTFYHDYPESLLQDTANTTFGEQTLYVQAMGGLFSKLSFPGLQNLKKDMSGKDINVAINKAELILPIEGDNFSDFAPPIRLYPTFMLNSTTESPLIDEFDEGIILDGVFNHSTLDYRFNIARQIQWFLNNDVKNPELFVYNHANSVTGYRGLLNGTKHPLRPIKLRVTFTRIE
jgi:hypothetical protein